jgi:hypothetical protein
MINLIVPLVSEPFSLTLCLTSGDLTNIVNVTALNKTRTDSLTECPAKVHTSYALISPSVRVAHLEGNTDTLKIKQPKYCPAKSLASCCMILRVFMPKVQNKLLYVFLTYFF